ncbi:MAG: Fic family protein [Bacteroidetes bacterium]|nr:Fic family protein [Bacteroidota bacterium]
MKTLKLKLIPTLYFSEYEKTLEADPVKAIKRIEKKKITLENFHFYFSSSAVFSSNIEGNPINLDTYWKNQEFKHLKKTKDLKEIEDLVVAYEFARKNLLTISSLLKAHELLSKSFLIKSNRGKLRSQKVGVFNEKGQLVYLAIEPELVEAEMNKLFSDIGQLENVKLGTLQVLYFASMIHLIFVKIHPFMDGNGRTARLLEKWFLAERLGEKAWYIQSERYYWRHRAKYYKNVHLGGHYHVLNYDLCIPFLKMMPESLLQK